MRTALEDTAIWIRKKHRKISDATDEDLLAIETAISAEKCEGTGFGPVISDYLINNRNAAQRRKRKIGNLLKAPIQIVGEWLCKSDNNDFPRKKLVFFTSISTRAHLRGLVAPTVANLQGVDYGLISDCPDAQDIDVQAPLTSFKDIYKTGSRISLQTLSSCTRRWHRCLKLRNTDNLLDRLDRAHLLSKLVLSLIRFHAARQWIERVKPAGIVVEFDRTEKTVPLVLAANLCGVKVITFQHGMINSFYGYLPLLADHILVWGQRSSERLIGYGVSERQIIVAGCPAISELDHNEFELLSESDESPVQWQLMFATNLWPIDQQLAYLEGVQALDELRTNLRITIRPHPAEDVEFYRSRLRESGMSIEPGSTVAAHVALENTHIVICRDTGLGLEAMRYGIPVIVLDYAGPALKGSLDWINAGAAVAVTSRRNLCEEVTCLVEDQAYYLQRQNAALTYCEHVLSYAGTEAATKAAEEIKAITKDSLCVS